MLLRICITIVAICIFLASYVFEETVLGAGENGAADHAAGIDARLAAYLKSTSQIQAL